MSNCKNFKNQIEKYIDGTIRDTQLVELKRHIQTCQSCREEYERCVLMQDSVKQAFSSTISINPKGQDGKQLPQPTHLSRSIWIVIPIATPRLTWRL